MDKNNDIDSPRPFDKHWTGENYYI